MAITSAGTPGSWLRRALFGVRARGIVMIMAGWGALSAQAVAGEPSFDPQSDGSDGALVVDANTVINLALAPTGSWMDPAPSPGLGVYDPSIWAVVFKYESVAINAGTVSFTNHPSGAPVVWLVEGDVVIEVGATVSVAGAHGTNGNFATAGPGGFNGGTGATGGFGPGAGGVISGGQYGSGARAYGNFEIRPLIGGSGGSGSSTDRGGGAGGGAILIAADAITLHGVINANGGNGLNDASFPDGANASGGAIRTISNALTIEGADRLRALPGASGGASAGGTSGRIRLEANDFLINASAATPNVLPHYTTARPGPLFQDETTPFLRIASINGVAVTDDPLAGVQSIDIGVQDTNSSITIEVHAWNVQPGSIIEVRAQQAAANHIVVQSTPLEGSIVFSTATAEITLNSGIPADIVLRVLP